jgi:hypothetical protein
MYPPELGCVTNPEAFLSLFALMFLGKEESSQSSSVDAYSASALEMKAWPVPIKVLFEAAFRSPSSACTQQ